MTKVHLCVLAIVCTVLSSTIYGATPPSEAYIRGDGTMVVNGKSFFPIGVRTEKDYDIPEIAKCGFNFVMGSGEWDLNHYKVAAENNLYIMAGHYVWASFRGTRPGIKLNAREEAAVKNFKKYAKDQSNRTLEEALKKFDKLPGVIGWKIGDEPEAKLTELVEIGYEIIKSYNPNRVVGPIVCDRQWFANYRNAGDVIIMDNYPLLGEHFPKEKKYGTSINETYKLTMRAGKAFEGKAMWYMAPMYPGSYFSHNLKDGLDFQDQKLPMYAGLIAGAKGVIFFHWGLLSEQWSKDESGKRVSNKVDKKTRDKRVEIMKKLAAELKLIGPIIVDGRPNDDLDIRWVEPGKNGPGPQLYRAIEYKGKQYLIVMNLLDVPLEGYVFGSDHAHNWRAYDAKVYIGKEYLSVTTPKPGQPKIKIAPRGSGVFVLTRRSMLKK